jgi:hypothetical protein
LQQPQHVEKKKKKRRKKEEEEENNEEEEEGAFLSSLLPLPFIIFRLFGNRIATFCFYIVSFLLSYFSTFLLNGRYKVSFLRLEAN